MKSIRQKTIIGMVLLLCCALGAICYLSYRSGRAALDEKNDAIRRLLKNQFEEALDEKMHTEAINFATLAQLRYVEEKADAINRFPIPKNLQLAIMASATPQAGLICPMWMIDANRDRGIPGLNEILATEVSFHEEQLNRTAEESAAEYLEIQANMRSWRSQTLVDLQENLPSAAARPAQLEHLFSQVNFHGKPLRIITLQVPLSHFIIFPRSRGYGPFGRETIDRLLGKAALLAMSPRPAPQARPSFPNTSSRQRPGTLPFDRSLPMTLIQVGWNEKDHPVILQMQAKLEQEISDLESEGNAALARSRWTLYSIGMVTLLATIVCGGMIITLGLRPLHVLSEAVSEVSEKNFVLQLKAESMPVEIQPTVHKLKSTLALLRQAFEREKQATADISHELRTPIASLNATLDVALKKQRTAAEYRDVLVDCRAIGKEMGGLVERIMSLAYLDAGQVHMKEEAVDANDLLGVCAAISKPLAEAQGLHFRMNLEPDIHLRTDPDKLREVVMNLLHNAIEYNRPGGEVEMNARTWGQNGLEVDIRDTGIGIGADIRDKIFERFYRGDPSRANTGVHAGLGLAIVREYITRLGGTLELESQVGRGSQFKIRVPNR